MASAAAPRTAHALNPVQHASHAPAQNHPVSSAPRSSTYTSRGRPGQRSPSRSLALATGPDMGAKQSRPVPQRGESSATSPTDSLPTLLSHRRGSTTTPLVTAYGKKENAQSPTDNASICRSPTWSPRGSLAARNQADKDRRDRERSLRKEAEEAKKRLKEFKEQGRKKSDPVPPTDSEDSSQPNKLQKKTKRASMKYPPAAMDTQRMPTALRTSMEQSNSDISSADSQNREKRRSRSSSFSSMLRLVTRRSSSRSRSNSRRDSVTDDDMYMSDSSTKSKSSFIGGVKLRQQQNAEATSPKIEATDVRNGGRAWSNDMEAQFDKITGRSSQENVRKLAASFDKPRPTSSGRGLEPASEEVNANMGRRRSQKLEAESKPQPAKPQPQPRPKTEHSIPPEQIKQRRSSLTQQLQSSRDASLHRLQNLVTPLKSAMKGGREAAKGTRTRSMPLIPNKESSSSTKQAPTEAGNYVSRARMRSQSRSLAGWHAEMAVKEANELAAARAAEVPKAAAIKVPSGPQMPPTPDESVKDTATPGVSQDTSSNANRRTGYRKPTLETSADVLWKQPIKANKAAAAQRIEQYAEKPHERRELSDIDKLPSQKKGSGSPTTSPISQLINDIEGNMRKMPSPTSPLSSDDEGRLRRHPAVMSWKVEKEAAKAKFNEMPRAVTMPIISAEYPSQPEKPVERPEDHPSLAALRGTGAPISSTPAPLENTLPNYTDPIDRPFSIIPTPVASPAPTVKSNHSVKSTKARSTSRTRQAASKAIDALKIKQAAEQGRKLNPADDPDTTPIASPIAIRRHSTPVELTNKTKEASSTPTYPFPDRHEPLVKPSAANSRASSRPPTEKRASAGKVTFHTPPESPRFLSVPTSYDSYRRPYGSGDFNSTSTTLEDDDIQLPVPVSELGKPNPPFAREGRKTSSPNRVSDKPKGSRATSADRAATSKDNKGYVYVNFSPSTSTSTISLGDAVGQHGRKIPKGFVIKNAEGQALDPVAKLFVICCGCRKWHDVPSNIYREMSKGLREVDLEKDKVAESKLPSRGEEDGAQKTVKRRRSGVITTVPCCWCKHEMSVLCCEGWSSLCYMSAQYHAGAGWSGSVVGTPRVKAEKERERERDRNARARSKSTVRVASET